MPARPEPRKNVSRSTRRVETPERLGEVAVLHGRADLAAERGELQQRGQAGQAEQRQDQDEQLAERVAVAEDRDLAVEPAGAATATAWAPKKSLASLLQHQAHPERDQQRVQRPVVHPADHDDLEQQPEQPATRKRDGRATQQRDVGVGDDLLGEVGGVGAGHQELAVRHVDHAHLTEGQRQSEGDEEQRGAGRRAGEELGDDDVHGAAFVPTGRVPARGVRARRARPRRWSTDVVTPSLGSHQS